MCKDIRMLATSEESLRCQVALVTTLTEQNFLRLNVSTYKIVPFSKHRPAAFLVCETDGTVMPAGALEKCLGCW